MTNFTDLRLRKWGNHEIREKQRKTVNYSIVMVDRHNNMEKKKKGRGEYY